MRKFILIFLLSIGSVSVGYPPLTEPQNEAETLHIRRILEFWKDREYPLAKSQIHSYLEKYPYSSNTDHFWALLGDMALSIQDFSQAVDYYNKILDSSLQADVQQKKWHALYQMDKYAQLYQEMAPESDALQEEVECFYFAEAAFREALTLMRYPKGEAEATGLCEQALPFYETLIENESFASASKQALAEIYFLLGRSKQAAQIYLELSKLTNNREYQYRAATFLAAHNPAEAAQQFKTLALLDEPIAPKATFGWLQQLADQQEWKTIEHERKFFAAQLPSENLATLYYYLGLYNFKNKMYHQACADLKKCIHQDLPDKNEKKAYITLLASAAELGDLPLCETCTKALRGDPKAHYLLASAHHKTGEHERALHLFSNLAHEFPQTKEGENASIEKIRLLIHVHSFKEAHKEILTWLDTYPLSKRKSEMVQAAIELSLTQLTESNVYAQLASDIERGIEAHAFHPLELVKKQDLLAKAYLKLNKPERALDLLQTQDAPDPLLIAQSQIQKEALPSTIIQAAEPALAQYPQEKALHLHLYNAYLSEGEHQKAAEHLLAVYTTHPLSIENRLWLAQHYTQQNPSLAIPIYESLLQTEAHLKKYDHEALTLADQYLETGNASQAISLLEKIITLDQKSAPPAQLQLANSYLANQEQKKAQQLYQKLEQNAQQEIAKAATLQLARLEFTKAPQKSLKKLQDLNSKKELAHEPIHLEASIDYAQLKAATYQKNDQAKEHLKLLMHTKESFSKQEDVLSQKYHEKRAKQPEKDLVYQAYMRLIDANIYQLESQMAFLNGDVQEGQVKLSAAHALFSSLIDGKYAVSRYLKQKASVGLDVF